jgi:hypothetical protein
VKQHGTSGEAASVAARSGHDEVLQSDFKAAFGQGVTRVYTAVNSQASIQMKLEKVMTRCIRLTVARQRTTLQQTKHARRVSQSVSQGNQEQRENASAMRA